MAVASKNTSIDPQNELENAKTQNHKNVHSVHYITLFTKNKMEGQSPVTPKEVCLMVGSLVLLLIAILSPLFSRRIPEPPELIFFSALIPLGLWIGSACYYFKKRITKKEKILILSIYGLSLLGLASVNIYLIGSIWASV